MKVILNNSRLIFKSSIQVQFSKIVNKYIDSNGDIVSDNQNKFCYYDITIPSNTSYLMVINSGSLSSILYAQFFDGNGQKVNSAFQSLDCSILTIPSGAVSLKYSGRYENTANVYVMPYTQNVPSEIVAGKAISSEDGSLVTNSSTRVAKYSSLGSAVDIYTPEETVGSTRVCFYDSNNVKVGDVITDVNAGKTTYTVPSGATHVFVQMSANFFVVVYSDNN